MGCMITIACSAAAAVEFDRRALNALGVFVGVLGQDVQLEPTAFRHIRRLSW